VGTFHDDHGDLHGITVVVETSTDLLYVGRCHEENDNRVVLHDADLHEKTPGGPTREEYLDKAMRFGVWAKMPTVVIPRPEVIRLCRLVDLATG